MPSLPVNASHANQLLAKFPSDLYLLHRDKERADKEGARYVACPSPDDMPAILQSMADMGYNVYFSANLVQEGLKSKARGEHIVTIRALFVDLDPNPGASQEAERIRLLNMLGSDDLPPGVPEPSAVWSTGGGVQALWALSAPLDASDAEIVAKYEAINKSLQASFHSAKGGGTFNRDRILRLPGGWNSCSTKKLSEGRVPALAELTDINDNAYPLQQFEHLLSANNSLPGASVGGSGAAPTRPLDPAIAAEINSLPIKAIPLKDIPELLEQYNSPEDDHAGTSKWNRTKFLILNGLPDNTPYTDPGSEYGEHAPVQTKLQAFESLGFKLREGKDLSGSGLQWELSCELARRGLPYDIQLGLTASDAPGFAGHVKQQSDTYPYRQVRQAVAAMLTESANAGSGRIPNSGPPEAPLDLTTDKLIGWAEPLKKSILKWRKDGVLTHEVKVLDYLVHDLGQTPAFIMSTFGPEYVKAIPATTSKRKAAAAAKAAEDARRRQDEVRAHKQTIVCKGTEVDSVTVVIPRICDYLANNPDVYVTGGRLSVWRGSSGKMQVYDTHNIGPVLDYGFSFCELKMTREGEHREYMWQAPEGVRKTFLAAEYFKGIRPVRAVLTHPVVLVDGTVIGEEAGYNAEHKILFSRGFERVDMPIEEAYRRVHDVFHEFPECAVPGALALTFTSLVRACLPGCAPMVFINAPAPGSGKSLLATICLLMTYGISISPMPQPKQEEEFDKQVKGHLQAHPGQTLFLDDFKGEISYQLLRTMLTEGKKIEFRILGTTLMYEASMDFVTVMTGNNASLHGEIMRRTITCEVDTQCENPEARKTQRTPTQLKAHVLANRDRILSAAILMLTDAFKNATAEHETRQMGSFEDWTATIGKSVVYCTQKLKAMGLLSPGIEGDVTPNMEKHSAENDGCAEVFSKIYQDKGTTEWLVRDIQGPTKELIDELLGTTSADTNDARGRRLNKYSGRPRTFQGVTYMLVKHGRKYEVKVTAGTAPTHGDEF
jgi:hypothetical protein